MYEPSELTDLWCAVVEWIARKNTENIQKEVPEDPQKQ